MVKNMGILDRIIRIVIAVVIGYLYYSGEISDIFGFVLMVFAWIFLITSMIGSCPLYKIIGVNTCSKN